MVMDIFFFFPVYYALISLRLCGGLGTFDRTFMRGRPSCVRLLRLSNYMRLGQLPPVRAVNNNTANPCACRCGVEATCTKLSTYSAWGTKRFQRKSSYTTTTIGDLLGARYSAWGKVSAHPPCIICSANPPLYVSP